MIVRRNRHRAVHALFALGLTLSAGSASAEDPFDVHTSSGMLTITTHGAWHVNKDYPWKATVGERSYDKTRFSFTESSASVSGLPAGTARLKGAVCNGPQCLPFTREVAIP
jgi:hypothetical protein